MQKSKIEQLIELLKSALLESDAKFTNQDLEKIAIVVYDSMSNPGRNFHNIQHIFEVAQGLDGLSVLAAIFHDVVYYQVDRSFRSSVEQLIYGYIEKREELFFIKRPTNDLIQKLQTIFGVKEGDTLSVFTGLNEFLSASVALEMMGPILSQNQLLKMIGLIESTIPFRKNPINILVERFNLINFPPNEIEDLTNRSVDFANRDVFNFAENDPGSFLNNTWNLMSETNYTLRRDVDNYTIVDYRMALLKTYLFFKNLDPSTVFTRYKNYPSEDDWTKLNMASKKNIEIGRKYLSVQLISIAIIEAIAEITGGNAPMALLMGEVRRRNQKIKRMEDYLGEVVNPRTALNEPLISLLENGRSHESSFDMKTSPIGAYIYKSLEDKQSGDLFLLVQDYFDRKITAFELLNNYPKEIIKRIIFACSEISSTRRDELIKLSDRFLY